MNSINIIIRCLLTVVIVFCVTDVVSACPTCKDGMAEDQQNMVQGYFWSIVFMMSMPFLIFFGLGGYFYYLVCKARAEQAAGDKTNAGEVATADTVPLGQVAAEA